MIVVLLVYNEYSKAWIARLNLADLRKVFQSGVVYWENNTVTMTERENTTRRFEDADSRDEYLALWEIGVLGFIFVFTLFGNCLVLLALYLRRYSGRRRKFTRMFFFVMNLSVADLLSALFNVLPQLAWDVTFRWVLIILSDIRKHL